MTDILSLEKRPEAADQSSVLGGQAASAPPGSLASDLDSCVIYQAVEDGWKEVEDGKIRDLINGAFVIKAKDSYYCGNDDAWHRCEGKNRKWIHLLFPLVQIDNFLDMDLSECKKALDTFKVFGGTFIKSGDTCPIIPMKPFTLF